MINGVGEVHVSASKMKVYGNMNVSEGDINIEDGRVYHASTRE